MDINEIIEGCKRGDTKYQTKLFEMFYPKMLSICMYYYKDSDDAKDMVQEGFISFFNKIHTFRKENDNSIGAWITKIMRNKCIDGLRKNKMIRVEFTENHVESFSIETETLSELLSDKLNHSIERLPKRYKEVIKLYYYEDKKYREMAEILGIHTGTCKSNVCRGKLNLKKMLLEL